MITDRQQRKGKKKNEKKACLSFYFLGFTKYQRPSRCETFEVKFTLPLIAAIGSMCGLTSLKKNLIRTI